MRKSQAGFSLIELLIVVAIILIIAAIARYLGKSRPAVSDPALKAIPASDREHVVKASLLLRLANAINLGRGRVRAA